MRLCGMRQMSISCESGHGASRAASGTITVKSERLTALDVARVRWPIWSRLIATTNLHITEIPASITQR